MNVSHGDREAQIPGATSPVLEVSAPISSGTFIGRNTAPLLMVGDHNEEPGAVILTCANCGAAMDERKCKLICRCGYFLSCSDYY